jgi:hypothetical protein
MEKKKSSGILAGTVFLVKKNKFLKTGICNLGDMWPRRAHILKPLTDQSGLKKRAPINWTNEMQKALDKMRLLMAANSLAAYPDHNKRLDIYTDASDFQLGACIIQEGRPIAYFSRKLTKSQQNYTKMEKEMLSIVATLEEF